MSGRRRRLALLARGARYAWASPNSLLGLLVLVLAWTTRGRAARVAGVCEVHGGAVRWMLERLAPVPGGAAALTLGHVILGRTAADLAACRRHERVHVRQYERWGPLFIPAYLAAGAWAWLNGCDPYADNRFEREAHAKAAHPPAGGGDSGDRG